MNKLWDKMDRTRMPDAKTVAAYADNPLWDELCGHMETVYSSKPVFEYSGFSVPGWNVKYRKSGRSLCTMYPMRESFVALVVVGAREKHAFDLLLPTLSAYTQALYEGRKDAKGLCWLMFEVTDRRVLEDVVRCIEVRRGP